MSNTIENPVLRKVYEYWTGKRTEGRLPSRADIDPLEIPDLLPKIMLTDVVETDRGRRHRYRLVGTKTTAQFGMDATGQFIDDVIDGSYLAFVTGLLDMAVDTGSPIYSRSRNYTEQDADMWAERVMLPLADDGVTVNIVLGCQELHTGDLGQIETIQGAQKKRNGEIEHTTVVLR